MSRNNSSPLLLSLIVDLFEEDSLTTAEIYMQTGDYTDIAAALHPPKVWEQFVDDIYSIFKCMHLENLFYHINNLHQNIKFAMEEESNGGFLDTYWNIIMEIFCSGI